MVDRGIVDEITADLYREQQDTATDLPLIHPQKMALFFIVIAVGAQYNLELGANDPIAELYCYMSQQCLAAGNFMVRSTISGVQTLVCLLCTLP